MVRSFQTGLISACEPDSPQPPYRGAGWTATLSDQGPGERAGVAFGDLAREVLINARSWTSAQRALRLILNSLEILTEVGLSLFGRSLSMVAHNCEEPRDIDPDTRKHIELMYLCTQRIPLACAVAAKASRRRRWSYGLVKYALSASLYQISSLDLGPYWSSDFGVSKFPEDHVVLAYAIQAAHSVLEELGFELRASRDRPSRIEGDWNPVVKQDLEARLVGAGIDIDQPILWTRWSARRKIEMKREVPSLSKARWSRGPVRDCWIALVDAIAYADWLRDCIASHNVKDLTRVLSPYDVANVQHLARRLLLQRLGFWEYCDGRARIGT